MGPNGQKIVRIGRRRSLAASVSPFLLLCLVACEAPNPIDKTKNEHQDTPPVVTSAPMPWRMVKTPPIGLGAREAYSLSMGAKGVFLGFGHDDATDYADGSYFSVADNSWRSYAFGDSFSKRYLTSIELIGESSGTNEVMIFGGSRYKNITKSRGERLSDGIILDLDSRSSLQTPSNKSDANAPTERSGQCSSVVKTASGKTSPIRAGTLFVWGGENLGTYLNDGGLYNREEKTWTRITGLEGVNVGPSGREEHRCIWNEPTREFIVFGGFNKNGPLSDMWAYSPDGRRWRKIQFRLNSSIKSSIGSGLHPCLATSESGLLVLGGANVGFQNTATYVRLPSSSETDLVDAFAVTMADAAGQPADVYCSQSNDEEPAHLAILFDEDVAGTRSFDGVLIGKNRQSQTEELWSVAFSYQENFKDITTPIRMQLSQMTSSGITGPVGGVVALSRNSALLLPSTGATGDSSTLSWNGASVITRGP